MLDNFLYRVADMVELESLQICTTREQSTHVVCADIARLHVEIGEMNGLRGLPCKLVKKGAATDENELSQGWKGDIVKKGN